jgi:hypothetical protein
MDFISFILAFVLNVFNAFYLLTLACLLISQGEEYFTYLLLGGLDQLWGLLVKSS